MPQDPPERRTITVTIAGESYTVPEPTFRDRLKFEAIAADVDPERLPSRFGVEVAFALARQHDRQFKRRFTTVDALIDAIETEDDEAELARIVSELIMPQPAAEEDVDDGGEFPGDGAGPGVAAGGGDALGTE